MNNPNEPTPEQIKAIFEWDVVNWSRCVPFFDPVISGENLKALELGGRRGGLSLWMAQYGAEVICSDLYSPEGHADVLHEKYPLQGQIEYRAIDALDIPFENHFDIVMFKSILGGVSRGSNDQKKQDAIAAIYRALRPGGHLLFAENLRASALHRFLRKQFVAWGDDWNYLRFQEIEGLLSSFSEIRYHTVGFFGAFGRTEKQRNLLGRIDRVLDRFIPRSMRYIVFVKARK